MGNENSNNADGAAGAVVNTLYLQIFNFGFLFTLPNHSLIFVSFRAIAT